MVSFRATFFTYRSLLVTISCLASGLFAAWELYHELQGRGGTSSGTPIAVVETREESVRRRSADSYVWTGLTRGDSLYRKDSVQVGPESAASIRLSSGAILEIGENSLIVLDDLRDLS